MISKNLVFSQILLLTILSYAFCLNTSVLREIKNHIESNNSLEKLYPIFSKGSMDGYFTHSDFWQIYDMLLFNYPQFVSEAKSIGRTYENREIGHFKIGLNMNDENRDKNKGAVLFTALHHSREPVGLSIQLAILLDNLCQLLNNTDPSLYQQVDINFIPIVNVDSYILINKTYNTELYEKVKYIRKNRNVSSSKGKCSKLYGGVDLNRNYGYQFNYSEEEGGSNDPCKSDYRGKKAFSEPETRAIRNFIEKNPEVKSCMNFHAWGNLYIYPYNYFPSASNDLLKENLMYWNIYHEYEKNTPRSPGAKFGDAQATINYLANGEASDWMLHEHGIIAFSPEIGDKHLWSNKFYTSSPRTPIIVEDFYPSVKYFLEMHKAKQIIQDFDLNFKYQRLRIIVQNLGISNLYDVIIELYSKELFQEKLTINKANVYFFGEDQENKASSKTFTDLTINAKNNTLTSNLNIPRRSYITFDVYFDKLGLLNQKLEVDIRVKKDNKTLAFIKDKYHSKKTNKKLNKNIETTSNQKIIVTKVLI